MSSINLYLKPLKKRALPLPSYPLELLILSALKRLANRSRIYAAFWPTTFSFLLRFILIKSVTMFESLPATIALTSFSPNSELSSRLYCFLWRKTFLDSEGISLPRYRPFQVRNTVSMFSRMIRQRALCVISIFPKSRIRPSL